MAEVADFGEVHFLCVGTPQLPDASGADLSQIDNLIGGLGPLLRSACLVVGKSTVPAGTAARIGAELERLAPAGRSAEVAWNPEFLREGRAVADTLRPDRIVAGVRSPRAARTLRSVYQAQISAGSEFFVTDLVTAELAKAAANSFLATKISFINAMAEVCEAAGGDVRMLARVLAADQRIGAAFLRPGLGFGGGCLPKDIRAFAASAEAMGAGEALAFLREVDAINLRRRAAVVGLAVDAAGGSVLETPICVLGAAFKPGSDDVRDSPALDVARVLHGMGAQVTVYDPAAMANARRVCPWLSYAESASAAAAGARLVLLATEWPEFSRLDPVVLAGVAAADRAVIDARHALDPRAWLDAGWRYLAPGVPAGAALMASHQSA